MKRLKQQKGYLFDLDGTLLNKEERVSPFTARVINRLVEQIMGRLR